MFNIREDNPPWSAPSLLRLMAPDKNIRKVVRYDHERGNIEDNAINFLHYDET